MTASGKKQKQITKNKFEITIIIRSTDKDVTPKILNISEPITVPMPISESVINVLIKLVKSSGVAVAVAINIAAPTSCTENKIKCI